MWLTVALAALASDFVPQLLPGTEPSAMATDGTTLYVVTTSQDLVRMDAPTERIRPVGAFPIWADALTLHEGELWTATPSPSAWSGPGVVTRIDRPACGKDGCGALRGREVVIFVPGGPLEAA